MPPTPQNFPPIRELLQRQGIWLDKKKSQHFLKSQDICSQIADLAQLTKDHLAIEVGAGLGNLTAEISTRAGQTVSVELDETFREWHEYLSTSYPILNFVYADFLETDLEALVQQYQPNGPVCGIGNLPYQITSEILFRFVNSPLIFDKLVFMVQKEVAERITAGPGTRKSGALTYKIALRYTAEMAMLVPASEFLPPPKVNSAVMVLTPVKVSPLQDKEEQKRVCLFLDRIFRYRRKTLLNSLQQSSFAQDKHEAEAMLNAAEIDQKRRPESLSLDEAIRLGLCATAPKSAS